jgi:hypothetical protein
MQVINNAEFTVEELEARFELEAIPVDSASPDWKCDCNFHFEN